MNNKLVLSILAIIGIGFAASTSSNNETTEKRIKLIDYINKGGDSFETKNRVSNLIRNTMTESEINDVYSFVFEYILPNKRVVDTNLLNRLKTISNKYNIFK